MHSSVIYARIFRGCLGKAMVIMLNCKDCSPAGLTQYKGIQGRDRLKLGTLLYKSFHHPAVHVDGLASDEFRPIRCKESDHV